MIRKADINDGVYVNNLFNEAKEEFAREQTFQWANDYPSINDFNYDVTNRTVFVYEDDGEIIGSVTIMYDIDSNYNYINGKWLNEEKYASIHRIVVKRNIQNKGIGTALLKECEKEIKNNGIFNVRVDTYQMNKKMTSLLVKNNYLECGKIYLQRSDVYDRERIAFQKKL